MCDAWFKGAGCEDADGISCLSLGMVCDTYSQSPTYRQCALPGEFDNCALWKGCNPDDPAEPTCELTLNDEYVCVRKCTSPVDCSGDAYMSFYSCLDELSDGSTGACDRVVCGFDLVGVFPLPNQFLGPCENGDKNPGICIPLNFPECGGSIDQGFCFSSGTAALGESCNIYATRTEPDFLCAPGLACMMLNSSSGAGVCLTPCNASSLDSPVPDLKCASGTCVVDPLVPAMLGMSPDPAVSTAVAGECR